MRGNCTHDDELVDRAIVTAFEADGFPSYLSSRDVGARLGVSPQRASALLHAGWAKRRFSIHLHLDAERAERLDLEDGVRARYGLERVLLVSASREPADLAPRARRRIRRHLLEAMSHRVAEYLDGVVAAAILEWQKALQAGRAFPPLLVGVGRGPDMRVIASHVRCSRQHPRLSELQVWPILGTTGLLSTDDATVIAPTFAHAYGGVAAQFPCLAFVPVLEADLVTQPRDLRHVFQRIRQCSVVVACLGAVPAATDAAILASDPALNADFLRIATRAGAVGHISSFLFDRDAQPLSMPYKTLGLGVEGLRHTVRNGGRVLLVAGGREDVVLPLAVALREGLGSVLISDTATARALLGEVVCPKTPPPS
jgi:DNA-binding transcriptional regulator LsrR (DeoR family)